ncbi:MAG: class I SAM-dependent methyltransferase [Limisphaerales bacterium]
MTAFDKIYANGYWGFGSGHGSLPSVTKGYRAFLENFLAANHIKSVLDFGCGDWQFSRLINWGGIQYTGVDVAGKVIRRNKLKYASDNINFHALNSPAMDFPAADLLISKDVLQHMTRNDIFAFIKNILPRYKFALITNCVTPADRLNHDIGAGEFRALDLRMPPYDLAAEVVFSFSVPDIFSWRQFKSFKGSTKRVMLVKS